MKTNLIQIMSRVLGLGLLAAFALTGARAQSLYEWNTTTTPSSWASSADWTVLSGSGTTFPGVNDTAAFTNVTLAAATTVTLDGNQSVNQMIFGDLSTNGAYGWVVSAGTPTTSTLTVAGANPMITINPLGGTAFANITAPILATNLTVAGPGILNMGSFSSVISGLTITNGATFEFGSGASYNWGALTFSGNGTVNSGMSASYTPSFNVLTNLAGVSSTFNFGSRCVIGVNAATPPNNIAGTVTINIGAVVGSGPTSRNYLQGVWENASGSPCTLNIVGTSSTSWLQCYFNGGGFNSLLTNATFNFYSSSAGVNKITCGPHNASGGNTFNMGALTGTSDATLSSDNTGTGTTYSVGALNTNTTFAGSFQGNCSLTKVGTGILTLSGNSTIGANAANAVNVNGGKLVGVTGGSFLAPAFNVTNGATNGVQVASAGGQWITTNLVYATGTNYLEFNFTTVAASTTVAPLQTTNLTINSVSNFISVLGGVWLPGTYPLVKYTGTFAGSGGFGAIHLGTLPLRVAATLNNNTANHSIDLVVSAVNEPLKWAATTGTWDIGSSVNWQDAAANATTYQEQLGLGDQVVLEDNVSGASPITITLNSTVTPSGFTATNSSKSYTISGNGTIKGAVALNKQGSGTLTLATTNAFTGAVNLNAGILNFAALTNLGAGTAINFGGGTLQYAAGNSADVSVRTVSLNSGGGKIDTAGNNVSFAKKIGNSGAGGLTKTGAGTLTLNTNATYTGFTIVNQGTLALGAGVSLSNSVAVVVNSSATLDASQTGFGFNLNGASSQILAGSGTVTGIVTSASGATITPGTNGTVGTLTFDNDLDLNGGTYVFDVGTNAHDLLVVGGNLNIQNPAGGTLTINSLNALTNGTYKLMQYAGSYNNGLAGLTLSGGQANRIFTLSDATSGEIDLVVTSSYTNNLTWTGDGANNYWDLDSSANWFDNHLLASGVFFDNGDTVTFDDSYVNSGSESPAVNIESGPVSPAAVVVNTTNTYTFDGGKITGGVTTLTKNGAGTLVLANVGNDYGGATVVNGGVLQIGDGSTSGTTIGIGNVTDNGALIFYQPDNSSVLGNIGGSGTLYQHGVSSASTLTLLGNNSYSGVTTVDTGVLQIGNGGVNGTLAPNAVQFLNGGTLVLDRAGAVSLANGLSGNGALSLAGSGTVTLFGANTYVNNTTVANGTLKLGGNNVIPSGGATTGWLVLDGGATAAGVLDLNGFNQTVNTLSGLSGTVLGQIVNNGGSGLNTLTIGTTLASTTYAGLIEDNNNSGTGKVGLNILGDGSLTYALTLSGANSYSGPVYIDGAKVILASAASQLAIGTGPVTLTNNGTLQMAYYGSGAATQGAFVNSILVPAGTTGNLLTLGRGAYSGNVTVHGTLNLTTSYVRSEPTGDWSASDGQINIIAGTAGGNVYWANGGNWSLGTAAVDLGAGVYFQNSANTGTAGNTITIGELTGTGTITDTSSIGGTNRITTYIIGGRNSNATFAGTIQNLNRQTAINKVGTGSWTLSGTDTATAQTTVSAGSLIIGTTSSFMGNSANITVAAGALLDVSAYSGLTLSANQTLAGSGVITGAVTLVDSDILMPGSSTVAGALSFSNSLTLTSTGVNVTNSFALSSDPTGLSKTNSLVVVAGDLTLTGTNMVVINPLNSILGAGTYTLFKYSGNLITNGTVAVGGTLENSFQAAGAFAADSDVSLTFSNAAGAVVLIVTPNGQNLTWTGGATNNWDLAVSTNWVNSALALTNFLTYDNVTFANGTSNLTVTLVGSLAPGSVLVNSDSNYVFAGSGKLTGVTGLTKSGSGTLTISDTGGNDYTGGVALNGGTLQLGVATALGATNATTTVASGATLDIHGATPVASPIVVQGSGVGGNGAIVNYGAALVNAGFTGNLTLSGDTTIGGTNRWDIYNGSLTGNRHNLAKVGPNQITLSGLGDMGVSNLNVQAGSLTLIGNTTLGSNNATLYLWSGSHVDFYGATATNSKPVSMTNATISSSFGTSVYGGPITLNQAETFTATTPLQLNGALGGSGGLVANGASTLTLNAVETYTGNTIISNGVLALTSAASIATSTNVDVATNAQLNVSALAGGTLTLGAEQTLKGLGTVSGSVTVPVGATVAPGKAGAMGALTITNNLTVNGNLMINYNRGVTPKSSALTAVTINLTGATLIMTNLNPANPLAAGDSFQLFNGATVTGGFSSIVPATPGAGLVWDTNSLISAHLLLVAAAPSAVTALGITSFSLAGTNVVVNGTNAGGGTFYLLTSTNLAKALNQWLPVSTNSAAGSGSFTLTNAMMLNVPQQFFILSTNNP